MDEKDTIELFAAVRRGALDAVQTALNRAAVGIQVRRMSCAHQNSPLGIYNDSGWSILHEASEHGQVAIAQLLLESGSDPNCRTDEFGTTPLHWAAAGGHVDMVALLLRWGADSTLRTAGGELPIFWAAGGGMVAYRAYREFRLGWNDALDEIPHFRCPGPGSTEAVELLMMHSAPTWLGRANRRDSILHAAAAAGNIDTVRLLLDRGLPANAYVAEKFYRRDFDSHRWSDRMRAAQYNSALQEKHRVIDALRREKTAALVLARGDSPLHLAARNGHTDVCRLLIQRECPVEVETYVGITPLFLAAFSGHLETSRLLLDHGAQAKFSLYFCVGSGERLLELLVQHGATVCRAAISRAAADGHVSELHFLLKSYQPGLRTQASRIALCSAAECARLEAMKYLISSGANADARDEDGNTALWLSARGSFDDNSQHVDAVQYLLGSGANPNIRGADRRTALHVAISNNCTTAVRAMLDHGADADLRDPDGLACEDLAISEEVRELIRNWRLVR